MDCAVTVEISSRRYRPEEAASNGQIGTLTLLAFGCVGVKAGSGMQTLQ